MGPPRQDLQAELKARRSQLDEVDKINLTYQAAVSNGTTRPIGADAGGTLNTAIQDAQGSATIEARIAEINQELARR